jgi:epoxyqueuosine reductase
MDWAKTEERRPSPFFWHPPQMHPYGDLQVAARARMSKCPGYEAAFTPARNHPPLNPVADSRREKSAEEFSAYVKAFALAHEADDVGISPMNPLYVFEGY